MTIRALALCVLLVFAAISADAQWWTIPSRGLFGGDGLSDDLCADGEILEKVAGEWQCGVDDSGTSVDAGTMSAGKIPADRVDDDHIDKATEIAASLCADGEVLKKGPVVWGCDVDAGGTDASALTGTIPATVVGAAHIDATNEIAPGLCSDGEVLKKAGGVWGCGADVGTTNADDLVSGTVAAGLVGAAHIDATTELAAGLCSDGEVLEKAGGVWVCDPDDGIGDTVDNVTDFSAALCPDGVLRNPGGAGYECGYNQDRIVVSLDEPVPGTYSPSIAELESGVLLFDTTGRASEITITMPNPAPAIGTQFCVFNGGGANNKAVRLEQPITPDFVVFTFSIGGAFRFDPGPIAHKVSTVTEGFGCFLLVAGAGFDQWLPTSLIGDWVDDYDGSQFSFNAAMPPMEFPIPGPQDGEIRVLGPKRFPWKVTGLSCSTTAGEVVVSFQEGGTAPSGWSGVESSINCTASGTDQDDGTIDSPNIEPGHFTRLLVGSPVGDVTDVQLTVYWERAKFF